MDREVIRAIVEYYEPRFATTGGLLTAAVDSQPRMCGTSRNERTDERTDEPTNKVGLSYTGVCTRLGLALFVPVHIV